VSGGGGGGARGTTTGRSGSRGPTSAGGKYAPTNNNRSRSHTPVDHSRGSSQPVQQLTSQAGSGNQLLSNLSEAGDAVRSLAAHPMSGRRAAHSRGPSLLDSSASLSGGSNTLTAMGSVHGLRSNSFVAGGPASPLPGQTPTPDGGDCQPPAACPVVRPPSAAGGSCSGTPTVTEMADMRRKQSNESPRMGSIDNSGAAAGASGGSGLSTHSSVVSSLHGDNVIAVERPIALLPPHMPHPMATHQHSAFTAQHQYAPHDFPKRECQHTMRTQAAGMAWRSQWLIFLCFLSVSLCRRGVRLARRT
jgi:hypothetical protein